MSKPRISYVDPANIKDQAMLAEFDPERLQAQFDRRVKKKSLLAKRLRGRPHHEKNHYRCRDRNLVRTVGHAC